MTEKVLNELIINYFNSEKEYDDNKNNLPVDSISLVLDSVLNNFSENNKNKYFFKLENDIIIQFGKCRENYYTFYPITFPSKCIIVYTTFINGDTELNCYVEEKSNTRFVFRYGNDRHGGDTAYYVAIGY